MQLIFTRAENLCFGKETDLERLRGLEIVMMDLWSLILRMHTSSRKKTAILERNCSGLQRKHSPDGYQRLQNWNEKVTVRSASGRAMQLLRPYFWVPIFSPCLTIQITYFLFKGLAKEKEGVIQTHWKHEGKGSYRGKLEQVRENMIPHDVITEQAGSFFKTHCRFSLLGTIYLTVWFRQFQRKE